VGVIALIMALPFLKESKQIMSGKQHDNTVVNFKKIFHGWRTVIYTHGVLPVSLVQASLYYVYGSAEFFLAGYLPEVAKLNEFSTGLVITSIIGIAIFARPYMGRISDKVGRRIPIILGCLISAVPMMVIPFVTSFWILLLLALVFGVGFASVTSSTPALISELTYKELVGTSIGFLDTMMDVGQTVGPIISGLILATSLRYVGVFLSLGILLILASSLFVLFKVPNERQWRV
jgi:MFS family permease